MILAGDIGGTNTRLALFDAKSLRPLNNSLVKYPSSQFKSLESILDVYLTSVPVLAGIRKVKLAAAGFGVAGPVRDGKVKLTNLSWSLDAAKLAKRLSVKHASLVNDLYATAAGIEVLPPKSLHTLRKGKPPKTPATQGVIAPGTGLGHASLIWAHDDRVINPSEAGHIEFAAKTELEERLRAHIAAIDDPARGFFKRCSYENIVSGRGILNVYTFLTTAAGRKPCPQVEAAEVKDKPGVISQLGLKSADPACTETLELFVTALGRQAGNFTLAVLAQAGLYLGGGIPPKILPALKHPRFLDGFNSKGSQTWVADVPVHVITNDLCALFGAANCARKRL